MADFGEVTICKACTWLLGCHDEYRNVQLIHITHMTFMIHYFLHMHSWVHINRIQFVGACNPPTDAGRVEMSHRFLRHVPLLLVDFPARDSLMQIYGTFNGGMMKLFPNLKGETEAMTEAMVELYMENQKRFTPDIQPQYFYSPRELSRWVRGVYEAIVNMDHGLTREELVRVWAHEGLRLFADRLIEDSDKQWCNDRIDEIARKWFAGVDFDSALARPMFYTTWLSKDTKKVEREALKMFLSARLRVFYEEELDVPLVVFDEVLDHVLRIDRVLRQPMGHLLLVGDSGAGMFWQSWTLDVQADLVFLTPLFVFPY
jgi:dynein heavy chain 1, cytosolic